MSALEPYYLDLTDEEVWMVKGNGRTIKFPGSEKGPVQAVVDELNALVGLLDLPKIPPTLDKLA